MYATLFGNGINVILNYLLIFGHFGFPKLGVEGASNALDESKEEDNTHDKINVNIFYR